MDIISKGIDISKHNVINWNKVRKMEIDFVIIRAGFGESSVDPKFVENIEGAIKCGLDIGIYWFSYAASPAQARKEAECCLRTISPYRKYINYPVFWDWEDDSCNYVKKHANITPTKQSVSDSAIAFLETVKEAGYIVGNYSNPNYLNLYFDNRVKAYDTWVAHVGVNGAERAKPNYNGNYIMHQYSWVGKISGIEGNVDMNRCFKEYVQKPKVIQNAESGDCVYPVAANYAVSITKNVITTYSIVNHAEKKLSDHFKVKEFASKKPNGTYYSKEVKVHNKLIEILETLYRRLNCSMIIINSGYRTVEHDRDVGGDGMGQHTLGRAADITCYDRNKKIIPAELVCYELEKMGNVYGIGYISERSTHVDTRPKSARWFGDESKIIVAYKGDIIKMGYKSFKEYFDLGE